VQRAARPHLPRGVKWVGKVRVATEVVKSCPRPRGVALEGLTAALVVKVNGGVCACRQYGVVGWASKRAAVPGGVWNV